MRYGMRIALRHRALDCIAVTNTVDDFPYRARDLGRLNILPELHVHYFGCRMQVQMHQMGAMNFQPIDAAPQFIQGFQIKDAADLNWFAAPLVRTEEIVVEQATVADMLAQIRSMQKDEQATIRHRQRLRERREGMSMEAAPREIFHAQVISLAA